MDISICSISDIEFHGVRLLNIELIILSFIVKDHHLYYPNKMIVKV